MNLKRVKKRNGRLELFNVEKINTFVQRCFDGLEGVSASEVIVDMQTSFSDKIQTSDIDKSLLMATTQKIYKEPNYSYGAARIVLSCLYKEVLKESVVSDTFDLDYRSIFVKNIRKAVKAGIMNEKMLDYDLKDLSNYIDPTRDWKFKYIGVKNIYDRYLLKINDKIIETPQAFYMRIAMGICLSEPEATRSETVKKLYDIYSNHLGMASTPTLFNSGTKHSQLSSCFKGDALVTTAFGQFRISDIREGDLVLTHTGAFKQVLKTRRKENDKRFIQLSFNQFQAPMFDFESTQDHKILKINEKNETTWVQAEDLNKGDCVVLGKVNNADDNINFKINTNLAKIFAFFFKFGKSTDKSVIFEFGGGQVYYLEEFLELMQPFEYKVDRIGQKVFVSCDNKELMEAMSLLHNSMDSFAICSNLSAESRKAFIKEIFNVYCPTSFKSISSVDKKFIFTIYSILLSLGVDNFTVETEKINNAVRIHGVNFYTISLNEGYLDFPKEVPEYIKAYISDIKVSDYKGDVYDLEVEDDHTFIVNGVVVHNCYLSEIEDSVDGIFDGLWQEARKSKYAGGLGFHVTKIRGTNSAINGTHGKSSGLIPWMKVYNDMLVACNQAGKRKGSGCAYLEPWHIDVEDFIDLRKTAGEERRRCHDLNTALWMNDLFFDRLKKDADWTLFCPNECPDLPDLFGKEFNEKYEEYEQKASRGEIKIFKIIKAKSLWKKALKSLFETSHPWITYKDSANIRYSNSHEGVLHGSNLCCVTGDQRVVSNKGLLTAKQLAENFHNEELFVVGRSRVEKSTPIAKTLDNQTILKVYTKHGFTHKVTQDHPLWVKDKGWVQAQYLKAGDVVETQQIPGLWGKGLISIQPFSYGFTTANNLKNESDYSADLNKMWLANRIQWCDFIKGLFHNTLKTIKENENIYYYYECNDLKFLQNMQIVFSNFGMITRLENWRIIIEDPYSQYILSDIIFGDSKENHNPVFEGLFNQTFENISFDDAKNYTEVTFVEELEQKEDVYCLKVLSNQEKAWSCNGLVTKNTEIFLHTKHSSYEDGLKTNIGETAVCNLASIVLPNHLNEDGTINKEKLKNTIFTLIRGLDNVIDVNFYPTQEAKNSNFRHRPIGLGTMGWADVFIANKIPQDSEEAIKFADELMEFISYNAILASSQLAKERGKYESYEGSKWSRNIFPVDTWNSLMKYKGSDFLMGEGSLNWKEVRDHVANHGMRNSNVMAIAPNASIAYQMGCEQSVEPFYSLIFTYENISGNNLIVNFLFVEEMKRRGLWSEALANAIKEANGDITLLKNIPQDIVDLFKRAFDRDQINLIKVNAARQKWVDQGISFNLYNKFTSIKFLNDIYIAANDYGLKSTYYLRNLPASKIQQVTNKKQETQSEDDKVKEFAERLKAAKNAAESGEECEMCQG